MPIATVDLAEVGMSAGTGSATILLVEDEKIIALAESLVLRKNGYCVITAPSGEDAIEAVQNRPEINLVLMDIDLGAGIDGTVAAQRILEQRELPIMFLSSHTDPEIVRRTEGITSYGYIVKNSGETVLLASIRMAFRLYEARKSEKRHKDELERRNSALKAIAESGDSGQHSIFHVIVRVLARELGTRYALIARIDPGDPDTAHTLAVWSGTDHGESFSYSLEGTPCRNVTTQGTCFYPREAQKRFPEDALLLDMGAESYWGTPLYNPSGKAIGVLALLDTRPMDDQPWFLPVLESFAARASAEIVRSRTESALEEKEKQLEATLSSIGDAVIRTDLAGRIIDLNAVAEKLTGWPRTEAIGRRSREIFRIANAHTGREVEDPIAICLECGTAVGLANHTMLIARDGAQRQIADSCAPITDRAGLVLGAVLVFRDVTEEYRRQDELGRLSEELQERVKELECLRRVSAAIEEKASTYREVFEAILRHIVEAMRFPDYACARIIFEKTAFESTRFQESPWLVTTEIPSPGRPIGAIQFGYVSRPPESGEHVILEGEQRMVEIIADQLELFVNRRRSESALSRSEERYRAVFEQSRDGICIADASTGRIIECNLSLAELVERDRSNLIGLPQTILHPPRSDLGELSREFIAHLNEDQNRVIETQVVTAGGAFKDVQIRANRLQYHGTDALMGVFRDITAVKAARDKVAFQSRLLDKVGQAIIVTDNAGTITYWNNSAETVYGWSAGEVLGRPIMEITPSDDALALAEDIMSAVYAGNTWTGEIRLRRRDGTEFPAIVSDTPVYDEDGKLAAIIGITTDVTALRAAEEKSRALLEENSLILREVNHRIKNNMGTMISMLSLQAEAAGSRESAEILRTAANRMESMLVLYGKLYQSSTCTSLAVDEYLPALLQEIAATVGVPENVEIRCDVDSLVLSAHTLSQLGMIVNELFTNSIKHAFRGCRNGLIHLQLTHHGPGVTIVYADDGVGIPKSVDLDTSPGFGLQFVRLLVQQLHGTVDLNRDTGTRVTITFQ